jgi:hypothetical protein
MLRCAGKAIDPRPFMRDLISVSATADAASVVTPSKVCKSSSREKEKEFGWLLLIWQHRLLYPATRKTFVQNCAKENVFDGLMLFSQHEHLATSPPQHNRISRFFNTRKGEICSVGCFCSDKTVTYPPQHHQNFGMHTVVMMASAYFGVKGCLYSFNGLVLLPFLRSMGVTGRDYQVLGAASRAPFAMKALFGAVSVNLASPDTFFCDSMH